MRKERKTIAIDRIRLNTGQLGWLPKNPRTWTQEDIDKTAASIDEDPDFLEDRPLLLVPFGEDFVVFGGNLRREGSKKAKKPTAPSMVYYPETEEDYETIKRRAMKDNGTFGHWDWDTLGNEWDDLPLTDWGVPAWAQDDLRKEAQRQMENGGLSTEGREGGDDYDAFTDKFKQKLTTDDCYTPKEVYDVVRDFVDTRIAKIDKREVVRPFFPGGDYEDLKQYPKGCVVIDNPPFSILSKILRFYCEHGIDFFLFGPHLTLFSAPDVEELTYLPVYAPVVYENGAVVSTGFITNMRPGIKIWIPAGFRHSIREVQRNDEPIDEYIIPSCVITSSRLGTVAGVKGCEIEIRSDECQYIKNLDAMEENGKGLFGGGI